jgi:hypothetical protein
MRGKPFTYIMHIASDMAATRQILIGTAKHFRVAGIDTRQVEREEFMV